MGGERGPVVMTSVREKQGTRLPIGPRFGAGAAQQKSVSCCVVRTILAWAAGRNEEKCLWCSDLKDLVILQKIKFIENLK